MSDETMGAWVADWLRKPMYAEGDLDTAMDRLKKKAREIDTEITRLREYNAELIYRAGIVAERRADAEAEVARLRAMMRPDRAHGG